MKQQTKIYLVTAITTDKNNRYEIVTVEAGNISTALEYGSLKINTRINASHAYRIIEVSEIAPQI